LVNGSSEGLLGEKWVAMWTISFAPMVRKSQTEVHPLTSSLFGLVAGPVVS